MEPEAAKINALLAKANTARREKRFVDAKKSLVAALSISRLSQDMKLRAQTLNDLARIERDLGNTISSIASYMKLVKLCQKDNNQPGTASALRHLGDIYRERSHLAQAETYYKKAVEIYRNGTMRSSLDLANALRGYGLLKIEQNDRSGALTTWKRAKKLYEKHKIDAGIKESDKWIQKLRKNT